MKRLFSICTACLALLATACDGSGKESGTNGAIAVENRESLQQTLGAEDTAAEAIRFHAADAWSASVTEKDGTAAPEWITVTPAGADEAGDYTLKIALAQNDTEADRTAVVTIACMGENVSATLTQKQAGATPDPAPDPVPTDKTLVRSIRNEFGTDNGTEIIFDYDSEGRIVKITSDSYGEDDGTNEISVSYSGNDVTLRMESTWEGEEAEPMPNPTASIGGKMVQEATATLDENGYVASVSATSTYYDESGAIHEQEETRMTATYDNGRLATVRTEENISREGDTAHTYVYEYACSWTNGNMTAVDYRYSGTGDATGGIDGTATYDTSVRNDESMSIDLNYVVCSAESFALIDEFGFSILGLFGQRSANMFASTHETDKNNSQYENTSNYSYEKDDLGRIVKITVTDPSLPDDGDIYTVTYMD